MKKLILLGALSVLLYSATASAMPPKAAAPKAAAPQEEAVAVAEDETSPEHVALLEEVIATQAEKCNAAGALVGQLNAEVEAVTAQRDNLNEEWESLYAQATAATAESDNAHAEWEKAKVDAATKEVDGSEEYPAAKALADATEKRWLDVYAEYEQLNAQLSDMTNRWNAEDALVYQVNAQLMDAAQRQDEAYAEFEKTQTDWNRLKGAQAAQEEAEAPAAAAE